jgi:hypothetical protein
MRSFLGILGLVCCFGSIGICASAQTENLSVQRSLGLGVRFWPSSFVPAAPMDTDLQLGTAVAAQLWFTDTVALEAGGWASGLMDSWSQRTFTSLSGGVLFKVADHAQADFYIAGRGIHMEVISRNPGYCCRECPPPYICPVKTNAATIEESRRDEDQDEEGEESDAIRWPPYAESRTSTLAFEGVAGIEWSLSPHLALDFEFGLIFAQVMGMHIPSHPEEKPTTYSSNSFGMTLHLGFYYYFAMKSSQ